MNDSLSALDDEWRFTRVNERAEEFLGETEETLLGAVIREAVLATGCLRVRSRRATVGTTADR